MAEFDPAFKYMIAFEDYPSTDHRYGKVKTDNDGGLVRFGINAKSLGKELLAGNYYKDMPNDEAIKIAYNLYNKHVWETIHGNLLTSQRVASKLFDMAVNMGQNEASKLCQRAANVNADGHIGPITVAAVNTMDELSMLKGLIYWWLWFIQQVENNHPDYKNYDEEWTVRAEKLPAA